MEDVGKKLARERREAIHKQLGELRLVLKDLETHYPTTYGYASYGDEVEARNKHNAAIETVKQRIRELDYEYADLA